MAVDKELYERYKQMKAEGKNITLSELKAQLEQEKALQNQTAQTTETEWVNKSYETTPQSGFSQTQTYTQPAQQTQSNTYYSSSTYINNNIKPEYHGNFESLKNNLAQSDGDLKKFALIGCPLGHSLSTYIHNAGFKSLGINASYELIETPPEKLVDTVKYLKNSNYAGFNVTIPHKLPISMFLDEIDESANIVNAINTIKIDPQTKALKGYNTDAAGFLRALPEDVELFGKTAGVLGTGGAARASICALCSKKVKEIKIFSRNISNCLEFLSYLRKTYSGIEFNAFQIDRIRDLSDISILVNATPIGMHGAFVGYTPVEENELKTLPQGAIVYDVIYNPKKTVLLKLAQKHNYKTVNGMDMLIYQALEAEKIWLGRTPDFKDMKIAALENID